MIEYYNEDCMVGMKRFPDKYFELAIVDPPYNLIRFQNGIGKNDRHTVKTKNTTWNNNSPTTEYWNELFRISENQIVWGANNFTLPPSEYFVIWDKQQTVDNFASAEYAWVSMGLKKPAKIFHYSIHQHNQINKIHPTQKPIPLYKWLLHNYAKKGDLILDTHVGSASSLIACYDMGFDAVGFELDKDYYEASKKRLEEFMAQGRLFDE